MKYMVVVLVLCLCGAGGTKAQPRVGSQPRAPAQSSRAGKIPPTLFGMHFRFDNNGSGKQVTWPGVPFGSLRLWDTDTRWQNMNPSSGKYDFDVLDQYLAAAKKNGLGDVLLTLSSTPQWAAANSAAQNCDYSWFATGDCSPPGDLSADGTGTNQHWRDFLYHLGAHLRGLDPAIYTPVDFFELWNEFTRGTGADGCTQSAKRASWLGTCAQLVRMAQDANCILTGRGSNCTAVAMNEPGIAMLPDAQVMTPNAGMQLPDVTLFGNYLRTTDALQSVDVIGVHVYAFSVRGMASPDGCREGAALTAQFASLQGVLPSAGSRLPIWSTEGGWGPGARSLPDPDMQEGFVARYYLMGWSSGFDRLYWYAFANSWGRLANQNGVAGCVDATHHGCLLKAATGYSAIYHWMVGSEMTARCGSDSAGNIWSCGLRDPNGRAELVVWDASQSCSRGTCTTSNYAVTKFGHYSTLDGGNKEYPILGETVAIGWNPILLVP
jgi:hypothetical protein